MITRRRLSSHVRIMCVAAALLLYLGLSVYQLGLPGIHYDEAKEAGVNAMELITGAPVTAFRGATIEVLGRDLPLMVQDYIGALNVFLAVPFLSLTGVGVPNLRALSVLTGMLTLLLAERAVSEWIAYCQGRELPARTPISLGGVIAVALLAVSPSFVFWSRQGIFVTNVMQPLCFLCVWQGVRWMRGGRPVALLLSGLSAGFALYAKLLAIWIVAPFASMLAAWWAYGQIRASAERPALTPQLLFGVLGAFLMPLIPLILFNIKTSGTISALLTNAGRSYYGVENLHIAQNLRVRVGQLVQVLHGEQFWYLGGIYSNLAVPWLALLSVAAGLYRAPRRVLPPLLLVVAAVLASIFTISDLFVTHYALVYPFVIATCAIALDSIWSARNVQVTVARGYRIAIFVLLTVWLATNLATDVRYHEALARSGGLADHSDASYHLAYFLQYNGLGAPIVLDWGLEAPIRFLTQGAVRPIEIFGYDNIAEPDPGFYVRLEQFLPNPNNTYLLHAPDHTVFAGRREAFLQAADERGLTAEMVETFAQRDGQSLYELWKVVPRVSP